MQVLLVIPVGPIRSLFTQELEGAGFAVVGVENGDDALRNALLAPPNAIVVVASMSGMSGPEFVRMLRAHQASHLRNVPVVGLVSGLGTNREFLAAGADCTVRKPVCNGDLVKAVRWAVDVYGERHVGKRGVG